MESGYEIAGIGIVIGLGVWGVLRAFTGGLSAAVEMHDLRVKVSELRRVQIERLRMLAEHNALDKETRAQLLGFAASMEDNAKRAA